MQAEGRQRVEGEGSVVWVRHAPGVSRYGSVVAVDACTDGRNARYREREGDAEPGGVVEHRLFFTRFGIDAGLRIVGSEFVDVETC